MSVLKVLQLPDPRLRQTAEPVDEVNQDILKIVDDMIETMYEQNGVGLAATQVGIHLRIAVMDASEERNQPIIAINPEIIESEGTQQDPHGCLSVPVQNTFGTIPRAAKVKFKALDRDGKSYEMSVDGVLAICIQHEIDHLNGILFIDHFSKLKQERIHKKIEKIYKLSQPN